MPSYHELLDDATQQLYELSDTPRIDAEVLLQHLIGQPLAWLIAHGESSATNEHIKDFYELVKQRSDGKPIAYILTYRDFWTLRLKVNQHVLIPRPDTEILVEQALERLIQDQPNHVLDLGTGSGAIALAIAKERPNSRVCAVDQSVQALQVARDNARDNQVGNLEFIVSDWFTELTKQRFDLIAANPPYIELNDPHLSNLSFEPELALISDEQGLGDLRRIIESAPEYLKTGGHIIVEHGFKQQQDVCDLMDKNGFKSIKRYQDLNHLPRCTAAQWNS